MHAVRSYTCKGNTRMQIMKNVNAGRNVIRKYPISDLSAKFIPKDILSHKRVISKSYLYLNFIFHDYLLPIHKWKENLTQEID